MSGTVSFNKSENNSYGFITFRPLNSLNIGNTVSKGTPVRNNLMFYLLLSKVLFPIMFIAQCC